MTTKDTGRSVRTLISAAMQGAEVASNTAKIVRMGFAHSTIGPVIN
jgi:hypothetical protein